MSRLVLVGGGGKRLQYFEQAAREAEIPVIHRAWEDYPESRLPGDAVKLDPPPEAPQELDRLPRYAARYAALLHEYGELDGVRFLNDPPDILAALDKRETKRRLLAAGVETPAALEAGDCPGLISSMEREGVDRVFVKPRWGAGAAGVVAFARSSKREVLYTSLAEQCGRLYNTKRIRESRDPVYNRRVLAAVFAVDALAERWIPKRSTDGRVYDLRVVWQFGHIAGVAVRGSRGPITNLHLNNMVLDLELSGELYGQLHALCERTMACFPGLRCAGIDVLLPKGKRPPMVLEVNGQGDLLHRDIYADNRIYREQIDRMRGWMQCGEH